jgi:dTDP-4-amino-4,6-dideoxygalactose transaminase
MSWKVPLFRIYWDQDDVDRVTEVIRSGAYWANGPQIALFEEGIRRYLGTGHALTFSSGTSALHAVLQAAGVGAGDEVIVPSFTFIATANAPIFVGARPVFADIEETTFGIDPEDLARRITPRTRAIIPVHYGGCPCRIQEIREIASDHGLLVIEDAAEAFGARVRGKRAGTFGNAAVLSFCQNKILSTGEGGAVVTDDPEWHRRLQLIRSHGRNEEGTDYFSTTAMQDYVTLGYNFRISSLTAALGLAQLSKVDHLIALRRAAAETYRRELHRRVPRCHVPEAPEGFEPVYQIFSVRVPERDGLSRHLESRKILTKVYFPPVHLTHYYRKVLGYDVSLPVTERVSREILSLPFFPGISPEEIETVVGEMSLYYGG